MFNISLRKAGVTLAAMIVTLVLSGCQTVEDIPQSAEWRHAPLASSSDDGKSLAARSRAANLPGGGEASPDDRPLLQYGTGKLVGAGRGRKPDPANSSDEGVTLNLVNTTIAEAAKVILGDILELNYAVSAKVDGKITIQTSTPVSRDNLVNLFQNALRTNGATIVKIGSVYQVEAADQAGRNGAEIAVGTAAGPDSGIGTLTRIVQLKYVAASEMRRILEPMVQKGAILRADDARNALTLSGTASEIATMRDTIAIFDVDVMAGMSIAVVPVHATQPDAMVDDLRAVFGSDKEGPMSGMVRFIPNQHLKSILVISPQPIYLKRAEMAIRNLDAKAQGPARQLFIYNVRNRPAKQLADLVESILSPTRRNTAQDGRNVAPRYQQTTLQSSPDPGIGGGPLSGGLASSSNGGAPGGGSVSLAGQSAQPSPGNSEPLSANSPPSSTESGPGRPDETEKIRITTDDANNSLAILASREDYRRVLRIIQSLDVVPNQVLIEATIAEVSLTDDLKFGVRWHFQQRQHDLSVTDAASNVFGSVYPGFSYAFTALNAAATLNALNDITKVNVISTPSLTVMDSRTATLQIGDQVPITTQSAVGVGAPNAPIVNSVSYRDTGIILSITPRINESGRVLLNIEQEVSSVGATTSSSINSPTIKQRRVKTTVMVNNGEALALGGLTQDDVSDSRNQIPILGDIPLIGNAFKQKGGSVGKTELIVLITPYVMRNLNEAREITEEYRRQFDVDGPRTAGARRSLRRTILRTFD